jgi:hypothetical protein
VREEDKLSVDPNRQWLFLLQRAEAGKKKNRRGKYANQ